jgi:hypothetical protein
VPWKGGKVAGLRSREARASTTGPGVKRAPNPAASRVCGTWKPRHGPLVAGALLAVGRS